MERNLQRSSGGSARTDYCRGFLNLRARKYRCNSGNALAGTLGNMEVNWKLLTMKFRMDELVRTLKGDLGVAQNHGKDLAS